MKRLTHYYVRPGVRMRRLLCAVGVALLLPGAANYAVAQTLDSNDGTQYSTANGIDELTGIDPSASVAVGTYDPNRKTAPNDADKVLCFYNVGAKRFLSIGGYWGTHASLNTTPHALWLETNDNGATYYIGNPVAGSGTGTHMGIAGLGVFMDKGLQGSSATTVTFIKAAGYSETNKVYYVKLNSGNTYLTAYPSDENKYCDSQVKLETGDKLANQTWKIITRSEYYELAKANPANMEAVIDFSFLMKAPDFRVNDTDMSAWTIGGNNTSANVLFGDNVMYCTYAKRGGTGTGHFNEYNENHQRVYGKLFYCYAKGSQDFSLYQDVQVHKPGWYVIRCNGFSTQKDGTKPLACLFAGVVNNGTVDQALSTTASLNLMDRDEANTLVASVDGAGAGKAFFEGDYENQVQICVEKTTDGKEISSDNPLTLRIGFYVAKGSVASAADDITAVDNFKLLYAGPRRNPELILDEDQTSLNYIANATDEYKNSVLHLKRTLNDNKWNSLILPVNLTCGQLKRTFGDAVKVAKLAAMTDHSIQFVTVEPKTDDEVMLEAFTPYIIYPPVVDVTSPAYTAAKFYTSEGESNAEWLGKDGESKSKSEDDALSITIPANHYDITMVSLDRAKFNQYVDKNTWISKTTVKGTGTPGSLECKGTLAKTYEGKNTIIKDRDNLTGDFIMYKGNLWQVPHDKTYGLKGFRCWFELTDKSQASGVMSLVIDGVEDSTTGIEDVHTDPSAVANKRGVDGVFTLDGQMVRRGHDTQGLPKGIYITNGRKVVVQ